MKHGDSALDRYNNDALFTQTSDSDILNATIILKDKFLSEATGGKSENKDDLHDVVNSNRVMEGEEGRLSSLNRIHANRAMHRWRTRKAVKASSYWYRCRRI